VIGDDDRGGVLLEGRPEKRLIVGRLGIESRRHPREPPNRHVLAVGDRSKRLQRRPTVGGHRQRDLDVFEVVGRPLEVLLDPVQQRVVVLAVGRLRKRHRKDASARDPHLYVPLQIRGLSGVDARLGLGVHTVRSGGIGLNVRAAVGDDNPYGSRVVTPAMDFQDRPRRLRTDGVRPLVSETELSPTDLVAPVFVDATADERVEIESMPGHERVPPEACVDRVREITDTGVEAVIVFGIPESKDETGTRAWAEGGVVQRAVRRITAETDAYVITDACLCEYTDHGHCGILEEGAESDPRLTVDNDATLERLERVAVSHAEAGADMIAPSGMMDGMVGAIRGALDGAGYENLPIMSYAAKYESAFYGPFRDAADGAPAFGDRRHYQMDPANAREARREVALDVEEGADVLMVKPALPYLDVVADVRRSFERPVAAYNVSGEYAMLHAAADRGWLSLEAVARESLLSIKRAGADLIITYFAEDVADVL